LIITGYEALCNLGNNIDEIYKNAIDGNAGCFYNLENYMPNDYVRAGIIKTVLPEINNPDFNIRCNQLLLKNLELIKNKINGIKTAYSDDKVGIIVATTNSGVEEYAQTKNQKHCELGNPALFLRNVLGLSGFYTTVSTACSSGIKAFSAARDLLNNGISDAVIVACVDTMAKVPMYGFYSLEVLSNKPSIPFSKNRAGMNLGEASTIFLLEKDNVEGIKVMGIGENSDIYHSTTPDPEAKEAISAINMALSEANISQSEVDYINAHGTGTVTNDIMEAKAISAVFGDKVPVSSTKPITGHCLGAAAGIETALCCKLLDEFDGRLYPHIYDGEYDEGISKINLVLKNKIYNRCKICMCNSFGFGGTNAIMIMGKNDE